MLLCWAYAGPPFFCTTFFEATGFLGNCMKLSDLQESEWHSWLYTQCKQCLRLFATVSHDISFLSCWPIWRVYRRCSHWFELGPTTHSLGWCPAWPPTAAATKYVSMFFFLPRPFRPLPPDIFSTRCDCLIKFMGSSVEGLWDFMLALCFLLLPFWYHFLASILGALCVGRVSIKFEVFNGGFPSYRV